MKIQLTPGYVLTADESGMRVTKRATGESFGPEDVVQFYPSWPHQPCWMAVRRAAAMSARTLEENNVISRFCSPSVPGGSAGTAHIHLRVTPERKGRYVRAARATGKNLSDWITDLCDVSAEHSTAGATHIRYECLCRVCEKQFVLPSAEAEHICPSCQSRV